MFKHDCMEHSPSSEAESHSASQEILRLLWNPKFHSRVHKILPLDPILSQIHQVHTFPPYFLKTHSSIFSHLRLDLVSDLFPSGFPTKIIYEFHICPVLPTCPARLIFIVLISLIIYIYLKNMKIYFSVV